MNFQRKQFCRAANACRRIRPNLLCVCLIAATKYTSAGQVTVGKPLYCFYTNGTIFLYRRNLLIFFLNRFEIIHPKTLHNTNFKRKNELKSAEIFQVQSEI